MTALIHRGFGDTDGLSMIDLDYYFRQSEKAKRDGLESCRHCGRGIASGKAWLTYACLSSLNDFAHPATDLSLLPSGQWEIVALGSECAKNLPKQYREKQENR